MSAATTAVNIPIDYKNLVADFAQAVAAPDASKSSMPTYKLASGYEMPVIAYGTFRASAGESYDAVLAAIKEGYRHFDLAHIYGNEAEIGKAFASAFEEGLVQRSDLFVTGKLWNSDHDVDVVPKACQHSLDNLGLEYLDMYLIHFPVCWKHTGLSTPSWGKSELGTTPLIDTWRAMEALVDEGKCRSIGVSNYPLMLLHDLVTQARIPVSCHQIETHVYYTRDSLVNYCLSRNICVTAHTPLGGGKANEVWTKTASPLEDPVVVAIAGSKPGATPATILLRFLLQRGIVVLPKSVKPSRMKENIELFGPDLTLTDDEMKQLAGLDKYISYKTNPNPITAFLGGPDAFTPEGTDIFD
jgi:diketogulonate reductase-like aldo/keto reductase